MSSMVNTSPVIVLIWHRIGMIVYTATLVNIGLLIVIALVGVGLDIEINGSMFNVSLSIGI